LVLAVSGSAIAAATGTTATIELKDGATLHIYEDGKMAMENKVGRPVPIAEGVPMETKDGRTILMKGNELWRLIKSGDSTVLDERW
jgi:hypothetical protein